MRVDLLSAVTTTATGGWVPVEKANRTYQASVTGSGSVSSTVVIEGSNDGVNAVVLGTISLSGSASATDGFAGSAPWAYVRARVSAISGTGATVNAQMGV